MATIGVLPASGRASRIGGIPKFCLPVSDERSLLQWHVEQMLEICDEVRVSTRSEWVPIVQNMEMNIKLIVREPSTMSDAINFMVGDYNDTVFVGMPDTYILKANTNIYKEMLKEDEADLVLGVWECGEDLKGRVVYFSEQLTKLKLTHSVAPLENPIQIQKVRKIVARLSTELSKREAQA